MLKWSLLVIFSLPVLAQVSTEEAAARLRAKSPTTQTAEADSLRRAVRELQAQVAALKEENAGLRRELALATKALATARGEATRNAPTGKSGIEDPNKKIKVGMSLDDATAMLGKPSSTEERGNGSKVVTWTYREGISVNGGRANMMTVREVVARVGPDGIVADFTDSK